MSKQIAEILIVDNASSDKSREIARQYSNLDSRIRLVVLERNVGFPLAVNIGSRMSIGDFILILNPDSKLGVGFQNMLEFANTQEALAVLQPTILSSEGELDSTGGAMDVFGHGFHVIEPAHKYPKDTFYAEFSCALVRKLVFERLGGLKAEYFMYNEDLDFCWRAWLSGFRVLYFPGATVTHVSQTSSRKTPFVVLYHTRKNRLAMVLTNYSFPLALFASFFDVIFYLGGCVRSSLKKDYADFWSFYKAISWFAKSLRSLIQKRSEIQSIRTIGDSYLIRRGFIKFSIVGVNLHLKAYKKLS